MIGAPSIVPEGGSGYVVTPVSFMRLLGGPKYLPLGEGCQAMGRMRVKEIKKYGYDGLVIQSQDRDIYRPDPHKTDERSSPGDPGGFLTFPSKFMKPLPPFWPLAH